MSCGVGCRHDSDLLWLRRRPAAAGALRPLAWKRPCAGGVALKKQNKTNQQTKRGIPFISFINLIFYFILFRLLICLIFFFFNLFSSLGPLCNKICLVKKIFFFFGCPAAYGAPGARDQIQAYITAATTSDPSATAPGWGCNWQHYRDSGIPQPLRYSRKSQGISYL